MQKYTDDEIENVMIPKLIDALYPVLIPIEQQDCAIQAKHHAQVTAIAVIAWREWKKICKRQSKISSAK